MTPAIWGSVLGGCLAGGALLAWSALRRVSEVRELPDASFRAAAEAHAARPGRLREALLGAGLAAMSPAAFVVISVLAAVVCAALAAALLGVPVIAVAAGGGGASLPWLVVSWRARARRRATAGAWPDVVDQLVSAVRAGVALPDAVAALAQTGPESARPAFARFAREYRATGAFARCADRLKDELADPVGDRILETLKMAREVGGTELVAVLRSLSASLREDAAARSELQARQSWVVNAARLGAAAPWAVLGLLVTRPEGAQAYRSPAGVAVVLVALVISVIAYRAMIAIGRLPEEKRWFR